MYIVYNIIASTYIMCSMCMLVQPLVLTLHSIVSHHLTLCCVCVCEQMLAGVEDDTDVQAAYQARAEETAEMAEFDETFSSQTAASGTPGEVSESPRARAGRRPLYSV